MPLDPNIILQGQAPQIQNPMDVAQKALTMRSMAQQAQLQDQQIQENQGIKGAFRNNVTTGPDGNPTVNKQGVLSDLMKVNPQKAVDYQKMFADQDLDVMKKNTQTSKEIAWGVSDEPSYQQARAKMVQLGLPNADKMPEQFDPKFVQNWQVHTLEGEKQVDVALKEKEFQQKTEEHNLTREQLKQSKQNQSFHQVQQMLETARGNPAVGQAEKDIYAAAKVKSLVDQAGTDPNNMNMQMVHLLTSEVGKMASGGVPTVEELKGLTPNNIPQGLSSLAEKFRNSPTPANAGAFIKQMSAYSDAIAKDGQKVIADKYGRVIEANAGDLSPNHYKVLKNQYVDRFKQANAAPAGSAFHEMSDDDLAKAYKAAGGQ